jgi:hypothetical protein
LSLFSMLLFFAAIALAASRSNTPWPALASMAFGIASLAFGLNATLDSIIFAQWARLWRDDVSNLASLGADEPIQGTMAAFDRALAIAGLAKPDEKSACRRLDERARGAMRLLRRQATAAAIQTLLVSLCAFLH